MRYLKIFALILSLLFALPAVGADGRKYRIKTDAVERSGWYICDGKTSTGICLPLSGAQPIVFPAKDNYSIHTDCVGGGAFNVDIIHSPTQLTSSQSILVNLDSGGNTSAIIRGVPAGYVTATINSNTCATRLDVILEVN